MKYNYHFVVEREDDSLFLDFPDFPEIISEWTEDDLLDQTIEAIAQNALLNALQARIDFGDEIPTASTKEAGGVTIYLSPTVTAKISLYSELLKRKVPKSGFASALHARPTDAQRLLDLFHESRSEQITAAFSTLGLKLSIDATVVPIEPMDKESTGPLIDRKQAG